MTDLNKTIQRLIYEFTDDMTPEEREEFSCLLDRMTNIPQPPRYFDCENCHQPIEVSEDNLSVDGDPPQLQTECFFCCARHVVEYETFLKDGLWNFRMNEW